MSPTAQVATSAALGAAVGAFTGFLVALAGSAVAGAGPMTRGRTTAQALGIGVGATAGAALAGGLQEKKELGA
jgi:hypothetical protein